MIQSCMRASNGVILVWGFQSRHLEIRSRKESLWHLKTFSSDLELGILILPLEFNTGKGWSSSSKNIFFLVDYSRMWAGGTPLTSMIRAIYSCSDSPGKIGNPVNSSMSMQPKLHISIAGV